MEPTQPDGAATLQARLHEPETAAALNRLLDRLDVLDRALAAAETAATQAPGMAAMFVDIADEAAARAQERGVDLDQRLHDALDLVERLTAPETTRVLKQLLDRMDRLEALLALADQAPGMAAMFVDIADEAAARARERGVDLDETLKRAGTLAGSATLALAEASATTPATPPRLGPFGLLRALRDADIQRALAFGLQFARAFGRALRRKG
ncbi:DUF1641 domain-containing protein [Rhodocaloribacter litoris]|uniref:DUF1641 domain-containing protein n=1 Tax=Rhodocaloribacter litoris TaxID=2558931 RepID=UPI0014227D0B|nr:DUF1641 domain-containing protein [Rhodocaloribacter litoris]QXD16267.1 DUF1641 domain-containing protein [Rhodocaloribacter litoris]